MVEIESFSGTFTAFFWAVVGLNEISWDLLDRIYLYFN